MSTGFSVARRSFLVATLGGICASCGNSPFAIVPTLVRGAVSGEGSNVAITRAQVEKIPYASVAIRIGDGRQVLLILRRYDGADLVWASADNKVIVTRHGRIVKTYGFNQDLSTTMAYGDDPVANFAAAYPGYIYKRSIDIEPGHHDGILVTSEFARLGPTTLNILGIPHDTMLWRETGSASLLDWHFTNTYWADAKTGFVWKSVQHPVPEMSKVELVTFRPAQHA